MSKELTTFGQRAVGLRGTPTTDDEKDIIAGTIAELIDFLHEKRADATDPEVARLCSLAITDLQTGQMWADKALSW